MRHLSEAVHRCVDILFEALEADRADDPEPVQMAKKVRASRRGTALRMFSPPEPVDEEARAKASEILRRKGLL